MIRREWEGDFVLFSQPEHARVSGVVAEFWGRGEFLRPEAWDDVLLAAYEHDAGWVEWEERPDINAEGLPAHFTETPLETNFDIFRRGVKKMYDRERPYAAALVSRHAANVYSGILRGWVRPVTPAEEGRLKAYVAEQEAKQAELCREINETAGAEECVSMEGVHRDGKLVTAMDTVSLVLCNGWNHRNRLQAVPVGRAEEDGLVDIALNLVDPFRLELSPWPFGRDSIEVTARGLRMPRGPFDSRERFIAALDRAAPFEMTFRLAPG